MNGDFNIHVHSGINGLMYILYTVLAWITKKYEHLLNFVQIQLNTKLFSITLCFSINITGELWRLSDQMIMNNSNDSCFIT